MRALLLVLACGVVGCDADKPASRDTPTPSAPALPALTPDDVCKAFAALPTPGHVTVIAASATENAIEPTADGTAMTAQVAELRAETGPVENGQRRIAGITLTRELTLKHDGTAWSVASEKGVSRSEIFYIRKTPDHDPRTLFGAQVVERYGPKGGKACALPQGHTGPKVTSAEICTAFLSRAPTKDVTTIAVAAKPGFTRPEQGETRDPPTLAEGQAAATVTELRVESDAPASGTRKHHLVTATQNVVLERAADGWTIASTQPVFRGEFLQANEPVDAAPSKVFADDELLERYRPRVGTACTLPKTP